MGRRPAEEAYREAGIAPRPPRLMWRQHRRLLWRASVIACVSVITGVVLFAGYRMITVNWSQAAANFTDTVMATPEAAPTPAANVVGGSFDESVDTVEPEPATADVDVDKIFAETDDAVTTTEPEVTEKVEETIDPTPTEPTDEAATEEVVAEPEAEASTSPTAVTAPPPVNTELEINGVALAMPSEYQLEAIDDNAVHFRGPYIVRIDGVSYLAELRISSSELHGNSDDLQTLIDGGCLFEDRGHAPKIQNAPSGKAETVDGTMTYGRRVYSCPSRSYSYAWWNSKGGFSADYFYVGDERTNLTEVFLDALAAN